MEAIPILEVVLYPPEAFRETTLAAGGGLAQAYVDAG